MSYPATGARTFSSSQRRSTHPDAHSRPSQAGATLKGKHKLTKSESSSGTRSSYGSLLDRSSGRPSPLFVRLADALFFALDSRCDVPGMRNTDMIEPAKGAWMNFMIYGSQREAQVLQEYIPTLYSAANIPVRNVLLPSGEQIPVLDRRGFLHLCVFEVKASPEAAWKFWNEIIALFDLVDPSSASGRTFPLPVPREAFPTSPYSQQSRVYEKWRDDVIQDLTRRNQGTRTGQSNMYNTMATPRYYTPTPMYPTQPSYYEADIMRSFTYPYSQPWASSYYGNQGSSSSSAMDTVKTVASIANVALSIFGGGGFMGGFGGFGGLGF
ncbi:hypothetical protein BDW22DRAFT_1426168 [Trametopsis cervina]|nr:hypothetical protein BDW22DRAFT_1426168 [Trametopsis cervina]